MEEKALRFIGEEIEPRFEGSRGFDKRPTCPSGFVWRDREYGIDECLSEWRDYARRGKMAHNMRPPHLETATKRGSRGVGRHYFRVRTDDGRVFDLYYDRAPRDTVNHKGSWHLLREMEEVEEAETDTRADGREEQP